MNNYEDNDDYAGGSYDQPESDADAGALDEGLRRLFNTVSTETNSVPPADAAAQIHRAVDLAWRAGHPPTPEELANDAGAGADPYNDASLIGLHQDGVDNRHESPVVDDHGTHFASPIDDGGHHVAQGNHFDVHEDS